MRLAIAGSTGSIGRQALEVVSRLEGVSVTALCAHSNAKLLAEQAKIFGPEVVALVDASQASFLKDSVPANTRVVVGEEALAEVARAGDCVLNAIVGFAGLRLTLEAIEAGKRVALANKESLVAAGELVKASLRRFGAELIPVDSEHSALFQCLKAGHSSEVDHIVLTSSGGPFRGRKLEDLKDVTVEQALAHPTWSMGPKITVDSSTLMNKGLEVIEAHFLFDLSYDQIKVVVHPQSLVHSLVVFRDGASIAQLSYPDMRLPIAYAITYPERAALNLGTLNLASSLKISFEPPDLETFRALSLAYEAGKAGGARPLWLNAANEVAVEAFLAGRIPWLAIAEVVESCLDKASSGTPSSYEEVLEEDRKARETARELIAKFSI